MLPRLALLSLSSVSLLAACDPTFDASKAARPTRTTTTHTRAERPAIVEAALSRVCDPNAYTCVGSNDLQYCGAQGLTQTSCSDVCGSVGFSVSLGCGYDAGLGGDACFCDDVQSAPAPSCELGWSCSGSTALSYCASGVLETWSCDAVCRDAGYDFALACDYDPSTGDESCFCDDASSGPPSCAPGDQACGDGTCVPARYICDGYDDCASGYDELDCAVCTFDGTMCNGSNHIDTCDASGISTWDCDAVCQQSGYDYSEGCGYDPAYGDSCFCNFVATCAADELTCGDGSCVPNPYVCDGYVDCAGGDDEIGCATECYPGDVACSGYYTLDVCNDMGLWVSWDCDAVCQDSGFRAADSCGYDSFSGGDACLCE